MDEITAAPVHGRTDGTRSSLATQHRDPSDVVTSHASNDQEHDLDFSDTDPVDNNCFAFSPTQLHKLLTLRNLPALDAFGGLLGLAAGLRTDVSTGLSVDETNVHGTLTFDEAVAAGRAHRRAIINERTPPPSPTPIHHGLHLRDPPDNHFVDRKRVFGQNSLPRRHQTSFLKLMWIAFNDKLIILLTISATISLAIGIYQSVDASAGASRIEWVDGVTIVVAIAVIVLASAAMDWQKNYKFMKLNERKEQRDVKVVRSGRIQQISVYDVLVGDVMLVEAGEVIAVDGVLIQASGLHIDESSVSGESRLVHKTVPSDFDSLHAPQADPFILSGTTVSRGVGHYLVTSVGVNSTYGRTLMSLRNDVEETPLQAKLGRLGKHLIVIGAVVGTIFFIVLLIRFLVNLPSMHTGPSDKAEEFLHALIMSVTVVVITVPEGLALNVTIALAFATKRMLRDNNLVRLLRSCETMGNATCVCSDKTGTLTQNNMTVIAGCVGVEDRFDDMDSDPADLDRSMSMASTINCQTSTELMARLSPDVKKLIKDSIVLNSTAFESDNTGTSEFVGSSTETALLKFGRQHFGMSSLAEERANGSIVAILPFDSTRKWMAVLLKLSGGKYRLLVKGAAELVLEYCAFSIYDPVFRIPTRRLEDENRAGFHSCIQSYASQMLRPVGLAFRDFNEADVLEGAEDSDYVNLEWLASGLVFIGIFGIRDPLRPGVVESVRQCQDAGVFVRMVTGDNFLTAKAIAVECGIFTAGGVAMDGPTFRDLTPEQMDAIIPRLQVLARSSPEDKLMLVSHLKKMNETVAVTGDGTNDALALKAADVGFAMGMQGTEVAKEAASIILLDDNFSSIVKAVSWGRTVNEAVKRFCQFEFTINITAGIITIVSELVGDSIFTVVQLLWINLSMDILASLGLATDSPPPDVLQRKPEPRNAPLVSITMWKMILGQALYQLIVVFVVHYAGWDLFNPNTEFEIEKLQTFVFNIYIWMQFFNQLNCRRVDNKTDIWSHGFWRNPWSLAVQVITIVGQFVIIFRGGEAFDTREITGAQWGWSILFGVLSIPFGMLIRQFPDRWVSAFFQLVRTGYLKVMGPLKAWIFKLVRRKRREQDEEQREMSDVADIHTASETDLVQREEARRSESSADRATATTQETARPRRHLDLHGLIEAAKLGREYVGATLELHPRTLKDDPIIVSRRGEVVPPSQDPDIMRHITRQRRTRLRRLERAVPAQTPASPHHPQRETRRQRQRSRWTWEWFLRTQRR